MQIIRALTLKNRRESHSHSVLPKSRPILKRIHQSSSLKQEFLFTKSWLFIPVCHYVKILRSGPGAQALLPPTGYSMPLLFRFLVTCSIRIPTSFRSLKKRPCPAFFRAWARGFLQAQNQDSKTPGLFCYFRILQRHYPY